MRYTHRWTPCTTPIAYTRLPSDPAYTFPPTTAGDESTAPSVRNVHRRAPVAAFSAYTALLSEPR